MCLWEFFWKKLAFVLVKYIKRFILTSVNWHHPIHKEPEQNKKMKEGWITFLSWAITSIFLLYSDIGTLGSQALGLRLNYNTGFPGSPACKSIFYNTFWGFFLCCFSRRLWLIWLLFFQIFSPAIRLWQAYSRN